MKTSVALTGVPETLLWTLYRRAIEARRPDGVLADPRAVELVEAIDYPFAETFGDGGPDAQWQGLRVRCFDEEIRRFLDRHPDGTVVAVGEGLETQFWRVDNGQVRWVSVDLPETIELRRQLLPDEPRRRSVACSALDERWTEGIDGPVLVTAQGLLMYLHPPQVRQFIAMCADRFPGGALLFDAFPHWLVAASRKQPSARRSPHYRPPPWYWGMDPDEYSSVATAHPNIVEVRNLRWPNGRGRVFGHLGWIFEHAPIIRRIRPSVVLARFGP